MPGGPDEARLTCCPSPTRGPRARVPATPTSAGSASGGPWGQSSQREGSGSVRLWSGDSVFHVLEIPGLGGDAFLYHRNVMSPVGGFAVSA
jgi:hypothetical protein